MAKVQGLTSKQQKFVDYYKGDATAAAVYAGYSKKTARDIGCENMKKPRIIKAIRDREAEPRKKTIATRHKRQEFWSLTMDDKEIEIQHRLKASELLGKSEADFTDRIILTKPLLIIKDLTGD